MNSIYCITTAYTHVYVYILNKINIFCLSMRLLAKFKCSMHIVMKNSYAEMYSNSCKSNPLDSGLYNNSPHSPWSSLWPAAVRYTAPILKIPAKPYGKTFSNLREQTDTVSTLLWSWHITDIWGTESPAVCSTIFSSCPRRFRQGQLLCWTSSS
jgi:hypothetical protein